MYLKSENCIIQQQTWRYLKMDIIKREMQEEITLVWWIKSQLQHVQGLWWYYYLDVKYICLHSNALKGEWKIFFFIETLWSLEHDPKEFAIVSFIYISVLWEE